MVSWKTTLCCVSDVGKWVSGWKVYEGQIKALIQPQYQPVFTMFLKHYIRKD